MKPHLTHVGMAVSAFVAFGMSIPPSAYGNTITVNSTSDPGAMGICTLRDAVTAANTDAAVNGCAAGKGTDTIDLTGVSGMITLAVGDLAISSKVTITGPGAGNLTISGGGENIVFVNSTASLTLANLTLSSGNSTLGGAIDNAGKLTVTDCTFSSNHAGDSGGAILNSGKLTVANCTFSDNSIGFGGGGAIFNEHSSKSTVTNSTFSGNSGVAVVISNEGSTTSNTGTLTVTNSTFSNNSGGAISNQGLKLAVTNSTFSNNSTSGDFGGAIVNNGKLAVTNSTFNSNSSSAIGGAIWNTAQCSGKTGPVPCSMTVTNSTFSGNSAGDGVGGALFNDGKLIIVNSTIYNNGAEAIYSNGTTTIKNSVLTHNVGGSCYPAAKDGGYNLDDGTTCGFKGVCCGPSCSNTTGTSLCNTTPNLDPAGLANNGGPTQTIALCTAAGTPTGCSAADTQAINAGGCRPTDQRGYKRPGIDPTTSLPYKHCTIGAYEANPPRCGDKLTACRATSMCTETDLANDPADCVCRNLTNDPNNCGTCGNVCSAAQKCSKGTCK